MQPESDLESALHKTILLYNRLRTSEITAKLVFFSPALVKVSFTGGFCYGCGVLEYAEGFAEQFKILSGKAELKVSRTREINPRTFEADFAVKARAK
jgi:hypothetical protein